MRVLLVEDDPKMAQVLQRGLADEGYDVFLACDGQEGLEMAAACQMDCIILDVMLPKVDGFEVARRLRSKRNPAPILMLTARDAPADVITGLDRGADDYLTKPFYFEVLIARMRAVMRRGSAPRPTEFQVADLVVDPATRGVVRDGRRIVLTRTEYRLLECLIRRAGMVVPREVLIEDVWGFHGEIENNTLDAFIRLLRGKIDSDFEPKLVHTIRGVGYCLQEESA